MRNEFIHGDCIDEMRKFADGEFAAVVTDIPYGCCTKRSYGLRSLDYGVADVVEFDMDTMLDELWRVCKGSFYIFCGLSQVSTLINYFQSKKCSTRLIVWEKTNPSPMNGEHTWLSGIEPCVFAKKGGATFNGHCENTVLRYPIERGSFHTTPKPVALMEKLVLTSTDKGDVVLDPFAGSMTTAVACIKNQRGFVMIEKDDRYFELGRGRVDGFMSQQILDL